MKKLDITKIIQEEIDFVCRDPKLIREDFFSTDDGREFGLGGDADADLDVSIYINEMQKNILDCVKIRLAGINKVFLCDSKEPERIKKKKSKD